MPDDITSVGTPEPGNPTPLMSRNIICPNPNGYRGPADRKARGSILVGLVLCLFFQIPGVLYFVFMSGYRYVCPNCGMQVGNDN